MVRYVHLCQISAVYEIEKDEDLFFETLKILINKEDDDPRVPAAFLKYLFEKRDLTDNDELFTNVWRAAEWADKDFAFKVKETGTMKILKGISLRASETGGSPVNFCIICDQSRLDQLSMYY